MNILFISNDLIGGNIAYLLKKEGHNVKLYIDEKKRRGNFTNLVTKTDDWERELDWVGKGKNGLIVFDDVGYGKIQDNLRKEGYSVFGGCKLGDDLELNRQFGKEIFSHYGIKTVPLINIDSVKDAINFVKRNPNAWVVKQNGHSSKSFNYVGVYDDGRDVIDVLENYQENTKYKHSVISLQEKIKGIEIGVGRYFNGEDWMGPIEFNIEHKKLFPGDLGPSTSEMGTLAWYDDNEENKLFLETLAKIKPYLQEIKFKGDFDINCIVNENGAFPLEATPRFGSPIIHLHSEIHKSPWGEFFKACADGQPYDLKWKKGFGLVTLITVPPFPYSQRFQSTSWKGINVYFDPEAEKEMEHVHFEEISLKKEDGEKHYEISDDRGYILYVTAVADTVEEAREKSQKIIDGIHIPKMFYRNDLGIKFINEDQENLKRWGYL